MLTLERRPPYTHDSYAHAGLSLVLPILDLFSSSTRAPIDTGYGEFSCRRKGPMLSQKRQPRMAKHQGTELGTKGKPMNLGGSKGEDDVSVTPVLLLQTIQPILPQGSREGLT